MWPKNDLLNSASSTAVFFFHPWEQEGPLLLTSGSFSAFVPSAAGCRAIQRLPEFVTGSLSFTVASENSWAWFTMQGFPRSPWWPGQCAASGIQRFRGWMLTWRLTFRHWLLVMWVLRFHKIQGLGEEPHCRKVGRKQLREGLTGSECRYMSLPACCDAGFQCRLGAWPSACDAGLGGRPWMASVNS